MSTDPMSEVSDALIYMAAIKFNTNHNIWQALKTFEKPHLYWEQAIRSNILSYELSYIKSVIKYRKTWFCDEKENLCFDTRRIIKILNW